VVHKRLRADYLQDAKEFGRQVRYLRELRGWSQDRLIAESGHEFNKKTLARVERGTADDDPNSPTNPELRVLIELCRVLGASVVIDVNRPSGFQLQLLQDGKPVPSA